MAEDSTPANSGASPAANPSRLSSVLVGIATYNELENLPSLVERIHELVPDAQILVVDDNSPDGTSEWCREFMKDNPYLNLICREGKLGLGTALATLMKEAVKRDADVLVTLDADWSHKPESIPAMLEAAENADVVIGSRYCDGGGIEDWPLVRRMISRTMNWMSRTFIKLPVSDASGNFRAYCRKSLRDEPWTDVSSGGYAFIEEILGPMSRNGCTFAEVPITFKNRVTGNSKITAGEAWGKISMLLRMTKNRWFE